MRRASVIVLAGLVSLYVLWRLLAPALDRKPEQDACVFGPIPNSRYRELLSEAERRQRIEWPRLHGGQRLIGGQIRARIESLSQGMTSSYERLAAMHAVLRALGAYRFHEDLLSQDNERIAAKTRGPATINFYYRINSFAFGYFDPVLRESSVSIGYIFPFESNGEANDSKFQLHVSAFNPSLILMMLHLEGNLPTYLKSYDKVCFVEREMTLFDKYFDMMAVGGR